VFKQLAQILNLKHLWPKTKQPETTKILRWLWLLIVFTVFSGAVRKWVLGVGAMGNALLLLQLLVPPVFYVLIARSKLPKSRSAPVVWLVFVFYAVLTALNPMNHTPYHGVFGLVLHTGFFLLWLAYLQKGRYMVLEQLIPLLILIVVVEFVLAGLQYALPGTHILNIQAGGGANNAAVGDAVRVSGTFSYIGGFQVMVPFIACLGWLMLLQRYTVSLVLMVLGMGLLMAFMSGSRGAVGFYVLYVLVAVLFSGNLGSRIVKLAVQGTLTVLILLLFVPKLQQLANSSYNNFMYRVENSDEVDERLAGSWDEIINFRGQYPWFGVGLGATYQGANALFGQSIYVQEYGGYESEPARIILEGGYLLFFLRLLVVLVFLKSTPHLPWPVKVFLFVVFFNSLMTFNIYQGIFYVLGIMLIDRGYYLKQQREAQTARINHLKV